MCIISFYKKENEFILTHNRDEEIGRQTSYEIVKQTMFDKTYYSPIDKRANGTWIFYSDEYVACILNGGETKPFFLKEKYKQSRGIILLHLLKYDCVSAFIKNENFKEIAPFTIFIFERITKNTYLLHWNEKDLIIKDMTNKDIVTWCSSTIYSDKSRNRIANIFNKNNNLNPNHIQSLHYKMKMERGDLFDDLATTSISQIIMNNLRIDMKSCQLF